MSLTQEKSVQVIEGEAYEVLLQWKEAEGSPRSVHLWLYSPTFPDILLILKRLVLDVPISLPNKYTNLCQLELSFWYLKLSS